MVMAHDGFLGGFHDLAWPVAHHALVATSAGGGAPFDVLLQVHVQHTLMSDGAGAGSGLEHDAAMGTLVPSRSPSLAAAAAGGGAAAIDAALIEQLASSLGVSVPSSSRYASCYSSPVCSPSKPAPFGGPLLDADAARLSCFAASGGKLSRVASSQSLLAEPATAPATGVAEQHASGSSSDRPSQKRKAPGGKSKANDAATMATPKSWERETRTKKCKLSVDAADEEQKPAAGEAGRGNGKGKEVSSEPPKDYIHVRARRGQATDSHSLAERVRREKISERMKLLQDLVPGCSKVTGKAVMLDEIISYVQSLQRQVEFLSMKLSTVNPPLEIDVDSFMSKDLPPLDKSQANQTCAPPASSLPPPPVYSLEESSPVICYSSSQCTAALSAETSAKSFATRSTFANHDIPDYALEGFHNTNSEMGSLWEEDDLQSLVLMGFRGNIRDHWRSD